MKNNKLKICHIITRMIVGGAQENTLLSCIGLGQKGHDVTLLTGPSPGPEGNLLKKSDALENAPIKIEKEKNLVRNINPVKDYLAYRNIKKFLKDNNFDIVHTHSSKAGIIGRAAAYSAGIPVIVHTIHGQAFHENETRFRNFIYKSLERWAAKRTTKIFAVAKAMINQALEAKIGHKKQYKVVYSGMELKKFIENNHEGKDLRKELNIPFSSKVIGSVARLFDLKGYEYFIPAAAKIAKEEPNTKFLIVGNGTKREELENQVKELNLDNNFIFVGLIAPNNIHKYIKAMDILFHLSLREGLPRAVVQSLACAKPAVAFNLDGTPEILLNETTGYTVETKNVNQIAEAGLKLLKNPNLANELGNNGQELVKDNFDWEKMTNIIEDEYYKMINRKYK